MIYFYAKTDNRKDLDRLRRTVALAKEFDEVYLMTSDFRSATYAKSLGIKKAVGIEDFRNIANVCERGDILIFDSDEHLESERLHQEMIDYFGTFVRISYDPKDQRRDGEILISPYLIGEGVLNAILVDRELFEPCDKKIDRLFFWGDSDYEKRLLQIASKINVFGFDLIEGLYFFAGYDEKLQNYFHHIYESEEYLERMREAKLVVSASLQSALEAAATGAKTLYFAKEPREYNDLLQRVGIVSLGMDIGYLQEGILKAKNPNVAYLQKLGVEQAAKKLKEMF